jgi:hypothetical protein
MCRSLPTSSKISLLMVLGGLALPACSSSEGVGPVLYVDVSLSAGTAAPARVHFEVMQTETQLAKADFNWNAGAAVLKVGIPIPSGASGAVKVNATGLASAGTVVATGSADGTIGAQSIAVVLSAVVASPDGGADTLPASGDTAPVEDSPSESGPDVATPDAPGADLLTADQVSPVDQGVDAGSTGDTPSDVPISPDGPGVDSVLDGVAAEAPAIDTRTVDTGIDGTGSSRNWSTPLQLQAESGNYTFPPSAAMDPVTGNAVVTWADNGLGLMVAKYTAATDTWSPVKVVSNEADLRLARVAVDEKGHWLLAWTKDGNGKDTTKTGLWVSYSADATTWSTPVQIAAGGADCFDNDIRIAMNRSGQAMMIWDHYEGGTVGTTHHDLYAIYFEGTTNAAPSLVATQTYEYDARVTIDGNGNGMIAWTANDPKTDLDSIWAVTFAKQAVTQPALIESFDDYDCRSPTVAMNAAGQGLASWQQEGASYTLSVIGRRYSASGSWASSPDSISTGTWPGVMSMAVDSYGTATLVWSKPNKTGYQCMLSTQTVGGTWNTENVETDDLAPSHTDDDLEPVVALDKAGNALVGWRKMVDNTTFANHLRWRYGNTWGPEAELGRVAEMFSNELHVAVSDDGHAIATWNYYHCDPNSNGADIACPGAKKWDDLSAAAKNVWGIVFASVYR